MAKKTNPVIWFEIPATNLTRAKKFYEGVFGVKLTTEEMGPMKMAMFAGKQGAAGAPGSLMKARGYKPSRSGTVVYFSVVDIAATLRKAKAKGGKVLMPRTSIGKYGFIAQFADTEGGRVAVHSMK
jgi:hypothetical protein